MNTALGGLAETTAGRDPHQRTARPAPAIDVPPAIDVRGLTKRYGRRTVVDGLDVTVPVGAVAGFVGPNGSGKTTTLRMLLGLVRPTDGTGTILGYPLTEPAGYLPRVGALIESPALYPALSGERNLASLAVLAGQDPARVGPVLDEVGLTGRGGDAFRTYSLGMKQRLAIGAALLSDPDLLVLDEPTNGLDPSGIRQMRDLVRSLAAGTRIAGSDGPSRPRRTVLVSSHLLAEVEQICDWIIVIEEGRLAYQGPTDGLMPAGSRMVTVRPESPASLGMLGDLAAGFGLRVTRYDGYLTVRLENLAPDQDGTHELAELNRAAFDCGITLVEITPHRVSLEDRYQGLVERSAGRLEEEDQ
jgi:ABC-2 type transport system ATP-binding protein